MKPQIAIFSAERTQYSQIENTMRTSKVRAELQAMQVPFKEVSGVYKGTSERSFVVILQNDVIREFIHKLSLDVLEQECYLLSEPDRSSFLVFADKSERYIGQLVETADWHAMNQDSYTAELDGSKYYIVKG